MAADVVIAGGSRAESVGDDFGAAGISDRVIVNMHPVYLALLKITGYPNYQ